MTRTSGVLAAMKASPGRGTMAPQSGGWGPLNSVAANAMYGNPRSQFRLRPVPAAPLPDVHRRRVRADVPDPAGPGGSSPPSPAASRTRGCGSTRSAGTFRRSPRTEGLKLASFDQLRTIAQRVLVARRVHRAPQGGDPRPRVGDRADHPGRQGVPGRPQGHAGLRGARGAATKFFQHPDPDYWNFSSFLKALLEEIFVYDALCLVFRPKYGKGLGPGAARQRPGLAEPGFRADDPPAAEHARRQAPAAGARPTSSSCTGCPAATTRRSSPAPTLMTTG